MEVVTAETLDSVADYRIVERPDPVAGAGEIRLKVASCGMGYVDALVALGRYQVKPKLPFTPGQEVAGIIDQVGEGVTAFAVGDRVMATSFGGGLAELVVVPQRVVAPIPPSLSFAQAAGLRINYVTALHALRDRAQLAAGEKLLVLGAAGGVGAAAVQLGRHLGAQVIACASTEAKREFAAALGAQATIDASLEDWRERLKEKCGGSGPDVVFDPVCGPLFEPAFRSLNWRGRHLVIGFAGGDIPRLPVNLPLMKGAALIGADVRQLFEREPANAREHLGTLLQWVGEGHFSPPVGRMFPLAEFANAMEFAMSGQSLGKPVVTIGQGNS